MRKPQITILLTAEFEKEFKKYFKKYRTLEEDFAVFKKAVLAWPTGDKSKHWNVLKQDGEKYILKVRMMCRAVRGASFRVIYYFDGKILELVFLEMYYKGNKEREDTERIAEIWNRKTA